MHQEGGIAKALQVTQLEKDPEDAKRPEAELLTLEANKDKITPDCVNISRS